jgi:hypothetical protein
MMYPDRHAPGADPEVALVDRSNWRELGPPDFETGIPQIIEEMLTCFAALTGLEPVAHLPAPYSLAADLFGQERLIAALVEAPDFVDNFLCHLTDRIFVPWLDRLTRRIPKAWVELSDASGSPLFISPRLFKEIAARPVRRLIDDYAWDDRVFVANYRGDHLVQTAAGTGSRRAVRRRGRRHRQEKPGSGGAESKPDALTELIEFKLSICPEFIIKLEADEVPVSFYVERAIQHSKPLYLGIGATRIDRNSMVDREVARRNLEDTVAEYARAIKTVSAALAHSGQPRSTLAWPGDIYIEDINAESDLEFVQTIVETVSKY